MSILYIKLANIFTQALIKQFPKAQNFDIITTLFDVKRQINLFHLLCDQG